MTRTALGATGARLLAALAEDNRTSLTVTDAQAGGPVCLNLARTGRPVDPTSIEAESESLGVS